MNERQYSSRLALEIPGKGHLPIEEIIVKKYNLAEGRRARYTGYRIVIRDPDWELKRCPKCKADLLVKPTERICPVCGNELPEPVMR